jgi:hypothetical protein
MYSQYVFRSHCLKNRCILIPPLDVGQKDLDIQYIMTHEIDSVALKQQMMI